METTGIIGRPISPYNSTVFGTSARVAASAPLNDQTAYMMSTLQQMLDALSQMQSGWGGFASANLGQPSVSGFVQQAAPAPLAAAGFANSRLAYASPPADLQRYINAVDNSGGVNSVRLGVGEVGEYQARSSLINGYASEFYAGGRIAEVNTMVRHQNTLYSDFAGRNGPNAQQAATFALVASRFKNANGSYNKFQLVRLLKATGNGDLVKSGVGLGDVETLSAVTSALKRGSLQLNQIYDPETGKDALGRRSIETADTHLYARAIKSVTQNPPNLGTNIKSQESGPARPDLLSFLGGSAGGSGGAGKAGNAGNAGSSGKLNKSKKEGSLGDRLGDALMGMFDLGAGTLVDLGLGIAGKVQEAFGLVGKLAKGDIGGALTGAVGLVTDTVSQAATLLSGKFDDAVGIVCEVLHPERHKPNLKLDTPQYKVNINYDAPKPAYSPAFTAPAYSAPNHVPPASYPQTSYGYQAPAGYVNQQAMYTQLSVSTGYSQAASPSTYSAPATWAIASNLRYGS